MMLVAEGEPVVSRQAELPQPSGRARRPTVGELIRAIVVPGLLYICLQFAGLVLHLIGAAHSDAGRRSDAFGTLGSVCSVVAWLVLVVGVAYVVVKLRDLATTRSGRRRHE
jgi:hypothetical protein